MPFAPDFLLDRLLYRDGLMLVVDKPAGLPAHGGPGGGDNLENYFDALRFGLPRPPALAHRLDRGTSGCLVLGRHPKALRKLHKLFSEGRIEKTYWAICRGVPSEQAGVIDAALKKYPHGNGWRVEVSPDGQEARTAYRLLASADGLSFIEAQPETGRTHQIRVHLASIGAPILGDSQYGGSNAEDRAQPMMLHARRVVIPISKNKPPVAIEAEPPEAITTISKGLGKLITPSP